MTPAISVIIPTHNRLPCLRQCLDALAAQRFPLDRMEVIVVADGCTDGTEAALAEASYPFRLAVLSQSASGAAAARNQGAEAACSPLLLFLDDDVIASTGLVDAHARIHAEREECVAVGPYLLDPPKGGNYIGEQLHQFWRRTFERMSKSNHHPDYRDIVTGNLSIPAKVFARVEGFNPAFPGCGVEDYEFGYRLLNNGVGFVFVANAQARHLETTDTNRSLRRNRRGGNAEVLLATLHPETLTSLRLAQIDPLSYWLVFQLPRVGKRIAKGGQGLLVVTERLRVRRLWRTVYNRLKLYWYWHGVADAVGTYSEWRRRFGSPSPIASSDPSKFIGKEHL